MSGASGSILLGNIISHTLKVFRSFQVREVLTEGRLNNEESGQVRAHRQVDRDTGSLLSGGTSTVHGIEFSSFTHHPCHLAQSALRRGFPPPLCASSDFSQSENPDSIFTPVNSTLAIRNWSSPRAIGPVLQFHSCPQIVAASPSINVRPTSPFGLNSLINPIESWWDSLPNDEQHHLGTSNPDQSLSISDDYGFSNVPSWPQALVHLALPKETGNAPQRLQDQLPVMRLAIKEYVYKETSLLVSLTRKFIQSLTGVHRISCSFLVAGLGVSALPLRTTHAPEALHLIRSECTEFQVFHMILDHLVNAGTPMGSSSARTEDMEQLFKVGLQYVFSLPTGILGQLLESIPELYGSALQQGLFCAAIVHGATQTLDLILSQGFDFDRPFMFDHRLFYPLEAACTYGQVEIVRSLLMHGADPNKFMINCPIRWVVGSKATSTRKQQLIDILLIYGATLHTKDALIVLHECSNHLVPLFVQSALEKGFNAFVESGALAAMLWRTDWGTEVVTTLQMVVNYHRAGTSRLSYTCNKEMGTAILVATIQGRLDAIDLLLEAGALPDPSCLIKAMQTDNISIFEQFLDLGIDPNLVAEQEHCKTASDLHLLRRGRCTAPLRPIWRP